MSCIKSYLHSVCGGRNKSGHVSLFFFSRSLGMNSTDDCNLKTILLFRSAKRLIKISIRVVLLDKFTFFFKKKRRGMIRVIHGFMVQRNCYLAVNQFRTERKKVFEREQGLYLTRHALDFWKIQCHVRKWCMWFPLFFFCPSFILIFFS